MTPPLLSPTELHTILSRGEGRFVEFKSAWDHGTTPPKPLRCRALRDKIADAVAAKTRRSEAAPSWRHSSTTASSRGTPAT